MALYVRPALAIEHAGLISLGCALALVRAAEVLGCRLQVKWPNDVLHEERKLAGILLESRFAGGTCARLLLGVGINVHQGPEDFPAALRDSATSMDQILGRRIQRGELLASYLKEVEAILDALRAGRRESVLAAWRAAWPHRDRRARDEQGRVLRMLDVNAGGELLVESEAGREVLRGGDLSLLPPD